MDIQTKFNDSIHAFIVRMPNYVTLKTLNIWSQYFLQVLEERTEKVGLLLDTNLHEFESIECLKFLRELLSNENLVKCRISRSAFVQPLRYRQPEIVSYIEAYFSNIEDAHKWLSLD